MTLRETLKKWFSRGACPTAEQFGEWIDSFFHKNDKIPLSSVDDLADSLNEKCSTEVVEALAEALDEKANRDLSNVDKSRILKCIDLGTFDGEYFSIETHNHDIFIAISQAIDGACALWVKWNENSSDYCCFPFIGDENGYEPFLIIDMNGKLFKIKYDDETTSLVQVGFIDSYVPTANSNTIGGVKSGGDIEVDAQGIVTVKSLSPDNGSVDAIDIDIVSQPEYGTIAVWLNGSEADGTLPGSGTNSGILLQNRWKHSDEAAGTYVDCMSQVAFTKNGVYYRAVEDYDTSAQMDTQGWDKLAAKSDIYQEVTITQFDESGLKINITGLTAAKLNAGVPIMAKGNGVSISIQYQYYGGTLYMMCTAWETSYDEINVYTCTTTSLSGLKTFERKTSL